MRSFFSFFAIGVVSVASAQYVDGQLVVVSQASNSPTSSVLSSVDKVSGSTTSSQNLTGFTLDPVNGGGINMNADASAMLIPGRFANQVVAGAAVTRVTKAGAVSTALWNGGSDWVYGVAEGANGEYHLTNVNRSWSHPGLVFDGSTFNELTGTQISQNVQNRTVNRFYDQVFVTRTNGIYDGLGAGATALVTASGSTNNLNGFTDSVLSADGLTLYIADSRSTGGIYKYSRPDIVSSFTLNYLLSTDTDGSGSLAGGARFLAVDFLAGTPTIYCTTAETNNNRLAKIVDTGAGASIQVLQSAGANQNYRGVVVVPEPASMLALVGGLGLMLRRRRRS